MTTDTSSMPDHVLVVDTDRYGEMFAVRSWDDLKEVLMTMYTDMTAEDCDSLKDIPASESEIIPCFQVEEIEAGNVYESSISGKRYILEEYDEGSLIALAHDWQGDEDE